MTAIPAGSAAQGSRFAAAFSSMAAVLRGASVGAISGAIAGVIAGGVGGRIAMRVTALTAGDADQGAITEAEEVVGVISFDGTMALIVFGGVFTGVFGGLVYAGIRPWLGALGAWRGLAFGCVLLASLGWTVIERDNFDFHTFGYATLNIAMFAAIFIAFGVLVAPAFDLLGRVLPDVTISLTGVFGLSARALGLLTLPGALAIAVGTGADAGGVYGLIPVYLIAGLPAAAFVLAWRYGQFRSLADLHGRPLAWAFALAALAIPMVVGGVLDVRAITHILGEA